jgi:amino acid permease
MPANQDDAASYGLIVGFIYIFNLIVGSGALTMPKAFETTGIILSSFLLVFLTVMSFITATFMFEAMAIANAVKNAQKSEVN